MRYSFTAVDFGDWTLRFKDPAVTTLIRYTGSPFRELVDQDIVVVDRLCRWGRILVTAEDHRLVFEERRQKIRLVGSDHNPDGLVVGTAAHVIRSLN